MPAGPAVPAPLVTARVNGETRYSGRSWRVSGFPMGIQRRKGFEHSAQSVSVTGLCPSPGFEALGWPAKIGYFSIQTMD